MLPCGCDPSYEGGYGDDGRSARYSMEWCAMHAAADPHVEIKASDDGLWVHLHGEAYEGAVNLSLGRYGPITKRAINEVWTLLRARAEAGKPA